jgi:hypothetical protein
VTALLLALAVIAAALLRAHGLTAKHPGRHVAVAVRPAGMDILPAMPQLTMEVAL